jgi:hypothetical protein
LAGSSCQELATLSPVGVGSRARRGEKEILAGQIRKVCLVISWERQKVSSDEIFFQSDSQRKVGQLLLHFFSTYIFKKMLFYRYMLIFAPSRKNYLGCDVYGY